MAGPLTPSVLRTDLPAYGSAPAVVVLVAAGGGQVGEDGEATFPLGASERERLALLPPGRARIELLRTHWLGRQALGVATGTRADSWLLEQSCARCGGPHGAPRAVRRDGDDSGGWRLSLSHTPAAVCAAVAPAPVGVDVEGPWDAAVLSEVRDEVLCPAERAALDRAGPRWSADLGCLLWTRKEALVKVGVLTLDSLAAVDVSAVRPPVMILVPPGPEAVVLHAVPLPLPGVYCSVAIRPLPVGRDPAADGW